MVHLPQSSPVSRFTAGAAAFFILSQYRRRAPKCSARPSQIGARVSSYPAHRLGHIPQCPDGLLGRPLPPLLVSLTGAAPRIAHSALGYCTDAQCLDVHNGLLSRHSGTRPSTPRASPKLSAAAGMALGFATVPPLQGLQYAHRANLSLHRTRRGF